jgi:hypothetical protein
VALNVWFGCQCAAKDRIRDWPILRGDAPATDPGIFRATHDMTMMACGGFSSQRVIGLSVPAPSSQIG